MDTESLLAPVCHICASKFSKTYTFKEKMFGFNDEFKYNECSNCGCLQIAEIPGNMDKYYPPYYYSFTTKTAPLKRKSFIKRLFGRFRVKRVLKRKATALNYIKHINVGIKDRILEVGCGRGYLLCDLFNFGFENVEGVDKYLPEEIDHGYGVKIRKKELNELDPDRYDVIMMNHVFEHMDQQHQVLNDCHRLLKKDGCLAICIPTLGDAWKIYGENWVQLDTPRHFFLHTLKSMEILADHTSFNIKHTLFDSSSFQFWASELYKKSIPLFSSKHNYGPYPYYENFSEQEMEDYESKAQQLNELKRGDTAVFYLYKK